jgi:hypothetical protein
MDQKFKLEYQYQLYLKRIALKEEEMHPEQKIQTRQAFFGACGQILLLMHNDIAELSEEEGVKILDNLMNQVSSYFLSRTQN